MNKLLVYVTLILGALVVTAKTDATILPAGMCAFPNLKPLTINFDKVVAYGRWNIIYVTDIAAFHDVDHAYHTLTSLSPHLYGVNTTRVFEDRSTSVHKFILAFDNENITEGYKDDEGSTFYFHHFPVAITSDKAALYVRCTDKNVTDMNADVRFIIVPETLPLSETDEKRLLEVDSKIGFKGKLVKLPRKFSLLL